jgi:hypothetical protein
MFKVTVMSSTSEKPGIKTGKTWEFGAIFSYEPAMVLLADYYKEYFESFNLAGGEIDLYLIPPMSHYKNAIGFGLSLQTQSLAAKPGDVHSLLGAVHASIFYRLLLQQVALKAEVSFGLAQWFGYDSTFDASSQNANSEDFLSAGFDLSFAYFITRNFFLEVGANAYYRFSRQPGGELGLLRPRLGFGISFGG